MWSRRWSRSWNIYLLGVRRHCDSDEAQGFHVRDRTVHRVDRTESWTYLSTYLGLELGYIACCTVYAVILRHRNFLRTALRLHNVYYAPRPTMTCKRKKRSRSRRYLLAGRGKAPVDHDLARGKAADVGPALQSHNRQTCPKLRAYNFFVLQLRSWG